MANKDTADDVAESHEDAAADGGSVLDKNVSRRTALLGTGIIGSTLASKSAGAVDIGNNEPDGADAEYDPTSGDLTEVLSLTLESRDVIVDVDGSSDIARDYLDDMAFPDGDTEVVPGDRVSDIEEEDRLLTTRGNNFDLDSDHIFQAPVLDGATNLETYYPYGHAFGNNPPTGDLSDTLNPTIGIKVDSVGIGQGDKSVNDISFSPPGTDTFNDRVPGNVDYSASIPGDGFDVVGNVVEFEDHRQEVTLPNVANSGELRSDEANTLGLQEDFDSLGDGPEGIFFRVLDEEFFVVGDNFEGDVDGQSGAHTGTATFVSAERIDDIRDTTFEQQSADIETSIIDLLDVSANPAVIRGQVTDDDGDPVPDVEVDVSFAGVTRSDTTDDDGRYRVTVQAGNSPYEVDADGFGPTPPTTVSPVAEDDIVVVDFTPNDSQVSRPDDDNLLVRLPVDGGDNPNHAEELETGAPLGINKEDTGSGFTQTDDFTMLATGSILPGDSVESQVEEEGADSSFVEDPDGNFFLEVVTDEVTKGELEGTLPGENNLTVEQLTLEDVGDQATTDEVLLDNREQILDELRASINAVTRDGADVVVQDVGDVENINDGDGDIDGIVIRSETEVTSPYDQSVAVSSVEIRELPEGGDELFDGTGAHPETNNIVSDLGLVSGEFNEVNADTITDDDIYKAQADPIDVVDKDSGANEQLGDFEVTNNGIGDGEAETERVESVGGENDLVYRDSINADAGSAQNEADDDNEANADRFGDNGETQYHDGFDILELREPVEELGDADVPHNPRGIDEDDTNVDTYYGDRFDGIRVRNEGALEGDNIEVVELALTEPTPSNNIDGEEWESQKTQGDDGFDAGPGSDTTFWFDKEDLASQSNLFDVVYFGDYTDGGENPNDNVSGVDHRSDLSFSIDVMTDPANVDDDQFGESALFEVMQLQEDEPDGNFDAGEQGLFFKGHGDRGNIAASDATSGGSSSLTLADFYDPNNEDVPIEHVYGDGDVEVDGLLDALADFRDGDLESERLLDALSELRS